MSQRFSRLFFELLVPFLSPMIDGKYERSVFPPIKHVLVVQKQKKIEQLFLHNQG
jgi:hypothetical protein